MHHQLLWASVSELQPIHMSPLSRWPGRRWWWTRRLQLLNVQWFDPAQHLACLVFTVGLKSEVQNAQTTLSKVLVNTNYSKTCPSSLSLASNQSQPASAGCGPHIFKVRHFRNDISASLEAFSQRSGGTCRGSRSVPPTRKLGRQDSLCTWDCWVWPRVLQSG